MENTRDRLNIRVLYTFINKVSGHTQFLRELLYTVVF